MSYLPSVSLGETIRVDRAALHAFVDAQADLIERTPGARRRAHARRPVPRRARPGATLAHRRVATLIGLAIYEDAERFIAGPGAP